ncbi:Mor transcription activator family protein [Pseudoxanthomonas winnipegensis]|uniref:Mor transcription activator family protein n=1 Tax=Pseudoxanthomonas winnipegensis TaxID=2480810 RepID=UPI0013EE9E74|nr:Mor transcription activator family protein [Pseudoxanthomonas winnipegensis]
MKALRNELFDDVAATAANLGKDLGLPTDRAEQLGESLADHLMEHWGGQNIYVPNCVGKRLSPRERAILDAHRSGTSVAALAREYGMSQQGLRALLRRAAVREASH